MSRQLDGEPTAAEKEAIERLWRDLGKPLDAVLAESEAATSLSDFLSRWGSSPLDSPVPERMRLAVKGHLIGALDAVSASPPDYGSARLAMGKALMAVKPKGDPHPTI